MNRHRRVLKRRAIVAALLTTVLTGTPFMQAPAEAQAPHAQPVAAGAMPPKLDAYKKEVATGIDGMYTFTQQMIDSVFSFGELGFQEFETQKYLTGILEKEGFTIQRGIAGIPTAWTAKWGSGKP